MHRLRPVFGRCAGVLLVLSATLCGPLAGAAEALVVVVPSGSGRTTPPPPGGSPPNKLIADALIINPIGPLLGILGTAVGFPSLVANVRYHHTLANTWVMTLSPVVSVIHLFLDFRVIGVKGGPRFSLSGEGLGGWYFTPMVVAGWGWTRSRSGKLLASAPLFGIGAEAGRTMHWGRFVLELGGGLHFTKVLLDQKGELGNAAPGYKPALNVSLGYGW